MWDRKMNEEKLILAARRQEYASFQALGYWLNYRRWLATNEPEYYHSTLHFQESSARAYARAREAYIK